MSTDASVSSRSCPRCARPSIEAFDRTGICVRCAGITIFSQAMTDKPDSAPPMPVDGNFGGPARIGPYTLISELGRGGMGVVYLAQHIQLGRIVALKVISSGGSAASGLEMRFLREARTIARLTHPHIIAVHDAGRDHGHAYFAMDYLEDGDLAHRLRAQPFAPREAATVLRSVAEAVAYSHAAGVLHRDLKPSNILLAAGAPRVADFGLASELDSGTGLTARTAILGTPHYLAPEALRGGSAATGVASDIFSLGVILYEMLTGRTPFAGASPAELPGLLAGGDAPALRLLAPQVPRDLATICAKCLEYDPARRYATATALAEDLRRWITGEPIAARPISAGSRLLRWARRRPALAATWLLSFSLAAASLTAAVLVNHERLRANREAAGSAALAEFLRKDFLEHASAGRDSEVRLRAVMDSAVASIPGRFATAPLTEAELRLSFAATYFSLGEFDRAEPLYRKAMALRLRHLGPNDPETLRAAIHLADCLNHLGRSPEAAQLIRPTLIRLFRLHGPEHADAISALDTQALIEFELGQLVKAEAFARRALALARKALRPDDDATGNALWIHAKLLDAQGELAEAAALSREAAALAERLFGPDHLTTLSKRVDLVSVEASLGHREEAAATLRQLHAALQQKVGPDHPETLRALGNLGTTLSKLGKLPEADEALGELVAARRRTRGPEHPLTLAALKLHAIARGRSGRLDEAIVLMREVAATSTRTRGPEHLSTLDYHRTLAAMLQSARRFDEALAIAQATYDGSLHAFGPEGANTLDDEETLANALGLAGLPAEADPHWRHLADTLARTQPDHWRTSFARGQLGRSLALAGHVAEAEPLLREGYGALLSRQSELTAPRRKLPSVYAEQLALICAASGRDTEAADWRAKAITAP